jgi:hypothetical protein
MRARDLFNLKTGTLIKGIKLESMTIENVNIWGRRAYLNIGGWEGEMKNGMQDIKTPFYRDIGNCVKRYTGKQALNLINNPNFITRLEDETSVYDFEDLDWLSFRYNDLVGIHLGEFALIQSDNSPDEAMDALVYSKILHGSGDIGYIVLAKLTSAESELELI